MSNVVATGFNDDDLPERKIPDKELPAPTTPEDDLPEDDSGMSNEQLFDMAHRFLEMTVRGIRGAAWAIIRLERRGMDVPDLRIGIIGLLRRVGSGQLLPEVIVAFAGTPALLRKVSALPLPDQKRLASGEPVEIALLKEGGAIDKYQSKPSDLAPAVIDQVFAADHLRTHAEQATWLRAKLVPSKAAPEPAYRLDRRRGGIVVAGIFLPASELKRAVEQLGG